MDMKFNVTMSVQAVKGLIFFIFIVGKAPFSGKNAYSFKIGWNIFIRSNLCA